MPSSVNYIKVEDIIIRTSTLSLMVVTKLNHLDQLCGFKIKQINKYVIDIDNFLPSYLNLQHQGLFELQYTSTWCLLQSDSEHVLNLVSNLHFDENHLSTPEKSQLLNSQEV